MKSKICAKAAVIAMLAMLTIGVSPLALAQEGGTGEASVGNIAPIVTSVTAQTVTPLVEVKFPCTVWDNNTLADIDNVQLILHTADAGVGGENHVENHYVFWFDPTDNSFYSVLGAAYIDNENGTYPNDLSAQSDNYSFAIKLSGAATAGGWIAIWTATDDNGESGSDTADFTIQEYISLVIDPTTQTFNGNPGDMGLPSTENITCTVTANVNFNIKTRLAADWIGKTHGETIGADNTHADNSAGPIALSSTENKIVWENVPFGEDVARDIAYTLDLPSPLRDDVYTTTFHVQAVKT